MDVRELAAELEGVLAPQVRDVVLKIGGRVLEIDGTATPAAQRGKSAADFDVRKPTSSHDAGVEGIVLAIGEFAGVRLSQGELKEVATEPGCIDQAGRGGPYPVSSNRVRL